MKRALPLLLAGVALVLAGTATTASARTSIATAAGGPPYQRWADEIVHVPKAHMTVVVHNAPCPGEAAIPDKEEAGPLIPEVIACAVLGVGEPDIYLNFAAPFMPADRFSRRQLFVHELGHVFSRYFLDDSGRARLASIFSVMPGWDGSDPDFLEEWVAESYRVCALHPRLTWRQIDWDTQLWDGESPYNYYPTPTVHRKACRVFRTAYRQTRVSLPEARRTYGFLSR